MLIAVEMAFLDHNIGSFKSVNSIIIGDTVDLLELAYTRLIILNLISRVFKLFNEEFKGMINKLVVKLSIYILIKPNPIRFKI